MLPTRHHQNQIFFFLTSIYLRTQCYILCRLLELQTRKYTVLGQNVALFNVPAFFKSHNFLTTWNFKGWKLHFSFVTNSNLFNFNSAVYWDISKFSVVKLHKFNANDAEKKKQAIIHWVFFLLWSVTGENSHRCILMTFHIVTGCERSFFSYILASKVIS